MNTEIVKKLLNSLNHDDNRLGVELVLNHVGEKGFNNYISQNIIVNRRGQGAVHNIQIEDYRIYVGYNIISLVYI